MKRILFAALAAVALLSLLRTPREPDIVVPLIVVPASTAAPKLGGTTIVVLRVSHAGAALVSATDKPLASECSNEGAACWVLEDLSGAHLADGACDLPELCSCSIGHDHARGCVVVHHEAVLRLKVPRLARRERLRLIAPDGREIGSFPLELTP